VALSDAISLRQNGRAIHQVIGDGALHIRVTGRRDEDGWARREPNPFEGGALHAQ
jgi:hypothetical protein